MRQKQTAGRAIALLALSAVVCSAGTQQGNPIQGPRAQGSIVRESATRPDAARFAARVEETLSFGGASKADWGVLVSDADSGEVLYARNANRYFLPASNAKLFTTAMALATLGPGFRIRTTIEASGAVDRLGHLGGDLVLVGRGDGNLSNRVFPVSKKDVRDGSLEKVLAEMADQVVAHGVKQIDGDVVADDSDFVLARFPSGWTVDDTVWNYGAAVSPIAVNDNTMTLEVRPGRAAGTPLRVELAPASGIYEVRNDGVTTRAGTEAQLRLERDPESTVFRISGSLPADAAPRPLQVAVTEPAEHAAGLLLRLLQARGVRIQGKARAHHALDADSKPTARGSQNRVLAEHVSPPLIEDVRVTNKLSLNLHAELMLRVAAKETGGAMIMDDAVAFAAQFRKSIGLTPDDVLLTDGSGLSRSDLVTPQALVQLLEYASRQTWGPDFLGTLPIAGEDGTLETRMKGTAAAGRVHAKSGSIDHVNSLSGYAMSLGGERLVFSILGNADGLHFSDATGIVDAVCVAMVEELGTGASAPQGAPGP